MTAAERRNLVARGVSPWNWLRRAWKPRRGDTSRRRQRPRIGVAAPRLVARLTLATWSLRSRLFDAAAPRLKSTAVRLFLKIATLGIREEKPPCGHAFLRLGCSPKLPLL